MFCIVEGAEHLRGFFNKIGSTQTNAKRPNLPLPQHPERCGRSPTGGNRDGQ